MPTLRESLADLNRIAAVLQSSLAGLSALADADLMEVVQQFETAARGIDASRALAAAEVARRSDRSLGYGGLAVRQGARTPEKLIARLTGVGVAEAAKRVRVGVAIDSPTFSAVSAKVLDGTLAVDQADAIIRPLAGLADCPALSAAVGELVLSASTLSADGLATDARIARRDLEELSILDAEARLRDRRFLRIGHEVDGMRSLSGLLDPESAAVIVATLDAVTNPRRGGPRLVDRSDIELAERLTADTRSDEQLRLDALVDLMRVASAVGHKPVMGTARPAVRVGVSARDLASPQGSAYIEGVEHPVSAATARRFGCDNGLARVVLDAKGEVLNLGRVRSFSPQQRIALAVRDGGCRWQDCDRPPSWCEAHHILEYGKGGLTDIENGILLCRHHHLLTHNNGWRIENEQGQLVAIPPPDVDPLRRPRKLPVKSRVALSLISSG